MDASPEEIEEKRKDEMKGVKRRRVTLVSEPDLCFVASLYWTKNDQSLHQLRFSGYAARAAQTGSYLRVARFCLGPVRFILFQVTELIHARKSPQSVLVK